MSWFSKLIGSDKVIDNVLDKDNGRFQWFRVLDVPGRTHIEFHEGTKPKHSEGCILMSNEDLHTLKWWCHDESIKYVLEIRDHG